MATPNYGNQMGMAMQQMQQQQQQQQQQPGMVQPQPAAPPPRPVRRGTSKAVPVVMSAGLAVGVFCGLLFGLGTGNEGALASPGSTTTERRIRRRRVRQRRTPRSPTYSRRRAPRMARRRRSIDADAAATARRSPRPAPPRPRRNLPRWQRDRRRRRAAATGSARAPRRQRRRRLVAPGEAQGRDHAGHGAGGREDHDRRQGPHARHGDRARQRGEEDGRPSSSHATGFHDFEQKVDVMAGDTIVKFELSKRPASAGDRHGDRPAPATAAATPPRVRRGPARRPCSRARRRIRTTPDGEDEPHAAEEAGRQEHRG